MIYLKSALVGLLTVFAAAIAMPLAMLIYVSIGFGSSENGAVGWDPISLNRPQTWIVMLGIFLAGFCWEFRRIASK
jgi:hypothetical protein